MLNVTIIWFLLKKIFHYENPSNTRDGAECKMANIFIFRSFFQNHLGHEVNDCYTEECEEYISKHRKF